MTTLKSFSTCATPNWKKRARYEHFWRSDVVFFRAPRFEAYFSVSSCERRQPTVPPQTDSTHARSYTTYSTHKILFYSNHCKLCIKYKSLTAIPDFKNDDIMFIYGAMACYKKRVTWLLMLVDEWFFFSNLDKNHCFPVDFIWLWSDFNVVSGRNVN